MSIVPSILEIARTVFAPRQARGEESPPPARPKPLRWGEGARKIRNATPARRPVLRSLDEGGSLVVHFRSLVRRSGAGGEAAPTCPSEALAKEDDNFPPSLFRGYGGHGKFFFGGE